MSKTDQSILKLVRKETDRASDFHIPDTLARPERIFVERSNQNMIPVHRPSWPDFIISTERGGLAFVEVKGIGDAVSANQRRTFNILTRAGFTVYIWDERYPTKLTKWKAPKPRRAVGAAIL